MKGLCAAFSAALLGASLLVATAHAQETRGIITGRVTDSSDAVLPGALVTLAPAGGSAVTDPKGEYKLVGVPAGNYTINVNYVGFSVFQKDVKVPAGQAIRIDAILEVSGQSDSILVTAPRSRGEAEQINRERAADNIVSSRSTARSTEYAILVRMASCIL
jgi:protocatechuate 3,4-dioxygenase beta subunit